MYFVDEQPISGAARADTTATNLCVSLRENVRCADSGSEEEKGRPRYT